MTRYRRRRRSDIRGAAAAVAAGLLLAVLVHGAGRGPAASAAPPAPRGTVAAVIGYARDQLGCPYVWGGTGPCGSGFDCSGLAMKAWANAGVSIPRTSQEQWAQLPHVSRGQLRPADLVFAAGSDGTAASPGHVVIYIGHGKVIQAYATGYPVMISSLASVNAVGYADPGAS